MKVVDNKEIGRVLREFRLSLHITSARKFAMDADLDPSHYSKVERGELPLTDTMVEKLDKKYGLKKEKIIQNSGTSVPHGTFSAQMHGSSSVTAKITGVNQEEVEKKQSIERSIELLIEDRGKVLSVIERLTALLEKQQGQGIQLDEPGTPGTENKKPAHV